MTDTTVTWLYNPVCTISADAVLTADGYFAEEGDTPAKTKKISINCVNSSSVATPAVRALRLIFNGIMGGVFDELSTKRTTTQGVDKDD